MPSEEENFVLDVILGIGIKLLNGRLEITPSFRMVVDQTKASRELGSGHIPQRPLPPMIDYVRLSLENGLEIRGLEKKKHARLPRLSKTQ